MRYDCAMFLALLACVPVLTSPPGTNDFVAWEAPTNSWPVSEPPEDLRGEGVAVGDVAGDFRATDQFGDEVSLWQFYGSTIVLDVSTMWCSPCQDLAAEAQALADDYRDDGVVYLTLMPQDLASDVPDVSELNDWSEAFDLFEPILADHEGYSYTIVPVGDSGFPVVLIIDETMVVDARLEAEVDWDQAIRAALDEAL